MLSKQEIRVIIHPKNVNEGSVMSLSGEQTRLLQHALLSAFPEHALLKQFVKMELGENLAAIVGGSALSEIVFNLIRWAEAKGRIKELVDKSVVASTETRVMRKATFAELCEQFEDVLTPYLDWVINNNSTLDPRGLGKDLQSGALPLDQIYVSLTLEREASRIWKDDLLDRAREIEASEGMIREAETQAEREEIERQREELLLRKRQEAEQLKPVSPAEALGQQSRTVIIGKPGCGKTTLLRYLACHFAEACKTGAGRVRVRKTEDFGATRLPILIRIAYYTDAVQGKRDLGLRHYLPKAFSDSGVSEERLTACFNAFLEANYGLILLDGLDEVTHFGVRGQIAARIESLAAGCGGNQIVVTSRIAGYRASRLGAEFTEYKLLDMTPEQISEFLSRYCPIYERALKEKASGGEIAAQATANRTAIEAALEKNIGVRRLATNPLLLAILTVIQSMNKRLPHHRVELYKHTVEIILMYRPMHRGFSELETIGNEEALPLFGPVALWLHKEHSAGMAPAGEVKARFANALSEELDKPVDSREVRSAVEDFLRRAREATGLFVERATGYYGFSHLTFEEYFTARQMVSDYDELAANIQKWRHLPRWEEPILLAISYISTVSAKHASDLIRTALLGQGVSGITGDFSPSADENILNRDLLLAAQCLGDCVRADTALYEEVAGKQVALYLELCAENRFAPLRARLLDRLEYLSGTRGGKHAAELLGKALEMPGEPVAVMEGLQRLSPLPEQVVMALAPLLSDENEYVRMSAAQTLLSAGQRVEQAVVALVQLLSDENEDVRMSAAQTLDGVRPLPAQAVMALMQLLSDENEDVRRRAAQTLLSADQRVEQAVMALVQLLSGENEDIRMSAAKGLGDYCAGIDVRLDSVTVKKIALALRTMLSSTDTDGKILFENYDRVHDYAWEALWKVVARQELERE